MEGLVLYPEGSMWLEVAGLRRLGFRKVSQRCWICRGRYGLPPGAHLTVFDWSLRPPVELAAFHVTFEVGPDNLHFYYREGEPGAWEREGRTPWRDMRRAGAAIEALQARADEAAERLIAALGGQLRAAG